MIIHLRPIVKILIHLRLGVNYLYSILYYLIYEYKGYSQIIRSGMDCNDG